MSTQAKRRSPALILAAALALGTAVGQAHSQAAGFAAPPLAAGVQPAKDWTAPKTAYVAANGTPLFRAPAYDPAQATGESLKPGDRPQVLAEANQGLYLLIGKDGRGVGYAPRSLMCPTNLCRDLKN